MARKENKFEIDELEERIAPSAVGAVGSLLGDVGNIGANVTANDTVSVNLPILGTVSVGVTGNNSVGLSL